MTIRRATLEDVEEIARVHVKSWQHAYQGLIPQEYLDSLKPEYRYEQWHKILSEDKSPNLLVSEHNDQIIGFSEIDKCRDDDINPNITGEIYAIYLHPDYIGQGFGQALWSKSREYLNKEGLRDCVVWVLEGNQSAISFYERIGFKKEDGIEKPYEKAGKQFKIIRFRREL